MSRLTIHPTYRYPNGLHDGPPSERGPLLARAGRWLWRGLLLVLGLLALVFGAWVASNWRDATPQPRPAELALPTPQVPAARNVYFTLLGLQAAADRDAATAGQALWQGQGALAQALLVATDAGAREAALKAYPDVERQSLGAPPLAAPPTAEPWSCDELASDCVALGLPKADALLQQRQALQVQGARCEATVDALQPGQTGAFEELLPGAVHAAAQPMGHLPAALLCGRWQHSAALLAFRQGRKEEAWRLLTRSNHWHRALLAGAHTLVSHQVLHSLMRRHLAAVTGLVAQDPAWVAQALPLLAPFGAPEPGVRRWMVAEAAINQSMLRSLAQPDADNSTAPGGADKSSLPARLLMAPVDGLYRHRIGWHPERTLQAQDQHWLQRIQQLDAGLPAVVAASRSGAAGADNQAGAGLARWWLNPMGRMLVEVAQPAYGAYLHRPLDLELHREAALLTLNALRLGIPPAARPDWARQQAASVALRERMAWSSDGRLLSVRPWAADETAQSRSREQIVIALERAAPA